MATGDSGETLESWLNKATAPSNTHDRWEYIQSFYQLINSLDEGPQVATRLLAHKIQSPQPREALQALTVLEACMNNCGHRFHSEATKFRFLNEMIKVLSPKYLGQWSPEQVKQKVTEVLYGWSLWLTDQPKVQQAYSMLKNQGVVQKDPALSDSPLMPPPSPRTQDSVFDQEDKAKLLARLLKSKRPEDLQTANRLIKSTINEEQDRAERVSRRVCLLEEVCSWTRQLRALLDTHTHTHAMQALYERCDRLRPSLFRLASDTADDDSALAQILSANDELTLALNAYRDLVGTNGGPGGGAKQKGNHGNGVSRPREIKSYHLIDLSALESDSPAPPPSGPALSSSPSSSPPPPPRPRLDSTLLPLDLELTSLELNPHISSSYSEDLLQLSGTVQQMAEAAENQPGRNHWVATGVSAGRDPLLVTRGCGGGSGASCATPQSRPISFSGSPSSSASRPMAASGSPDSLADVYVPLDAIKPSRLEPITVFDRGGVHVSLHFAKDTPPGRPDVAVAIVSAVNTSTLPVKGFLFQAAVPKTMRVKLLPASGRDLPPYMPLLPPAALSQALLLANPQRLKVCVRYRLSLLHGEQQLCETGELDQLPDWALWLGLQNL